MSATKFQGNPNATALSLPAPTAELLVKPDAIFLEIPLSPGSFVLKVLPVCGTLGNDSLDAPDLFVFSPGHNIAIPVSMGYFDWSIDSPRPLSAIRPISRQRINEDRTYETLTTIEGEPGPDNIVGELTGTSFISASYIEHNQHLNRPPRKDTALFIVNPDRRLDPSDSVIH